MIVGAGALGSLFGALLHEAGRRVTLIERNPQTIRAIRRHGLILETDGEERRVDVDIRSARRVRDRCDMLLLFVKSYDTEGAVACVEHVRTAATWVGSFQNGIGNVEQIARIVDTSKIFAGSLAYSSEQTGINRIRYTGGAGALRISPMCPDAAGFGGAASVFDDLGFPVETPSDYRSQLWNKLIMNASANALAAVTGFTAGELVRDDSCREIMDRTAREAAHVALAHGIAIDRPDDPVAPLYRALEGIGANKPTMLQDVERGRQTEIDALNGAVVAAGTAVGVEAPFNQMLALQIRSIEARRLSPVRLGHEGLPVSVAKPHDLSVMP